MAAGLRTAAPDLGAGFADEPALARWQLRLSEERSDATTSRGWFKVTLRGTATVVATAGGATVGTLSAEATATSTADAATAARQAGEVLARRAAEVARDQLLLILLRNRTEGSAP
jgi:hypothetical protein